MRIDAKKPSRVIGGRHERVGNIMRGTARSRPLFGARRGEAVAVLMKVAERLEAAAPTTRMAPAHPAWRSLCERSASPRSSGFCQCA